MSDILDNQQRGDHANDPLSIGELIPLQQAAEYAGLTRDSLQEYIRTSTGCRIVDSFVDARFEHIGFLAKQ